MTQSRLAETLTDVSFKGGSGESKGIHFESLPPQVQNMM
jgi:hypothetical protein